MPLTQQQQEPEVLFQRRDARQLLLMRTGLGFSCFHTAYWIWYTTDFIPIVNASPMSELHIDPALGLAGIAFAAGIQAMFIYYPRCLVSKITYRPAGFVIDEETVVPTAQIWIYTHQLPWVRPASRPASVMPVTKDYIRRQNDPNNNDDDELRTLLDPISKDALTIVNDLKGDIQKFDGVLTIKNPAQKSWLPWQAPFLLDFGEDESCQVPSPARLVRALLYPEQLALYDRHDDDDYYYYHDDDDGGDYYEEETPARYRQRPRFSSPGRYQSSAAAKGRSSGRQKESRLRRIARQRQYRR